MGQKVNPRGFRIGVNNLWRIESQCYGKTFTNPRRLYKKMLPNANYLSKMFESKMFIKGEMFSIIKDNNCNYNIAYVSLIQNNEVPIQILKLSSSNLFNTKLQNYNAGLWYKNGSLLCAFLRENLKKGLPFRKIVTIIKTLFFNKKNYNVVLKAVCGTQFFEFTGLKIQYAGRFGSSRSRMSNKIVFRTGSVSLQKLGTYIEFYEMPLHTKQGVCNLRVWMAYRTSTTEFAYEKI